MPEFHEQIYGRPKELHDKGLNLKIKIEYLHLRWSTVSADAVNVPMQTDCWNKDVRAKRTAWIVGGVD